jgi:putative RecB family exonuclease
VEPDHIFELPVLVGVVDAIVQEGDSICLVDYKTAARKPNGDVNSMQLTAYSLGVQSLGFNPEKLDYRYEYLVKTKEPAIFQHPVEITEHDRERFVKITERVWRSIRQAIFFPNPSFYCSGCVYQSKCKDW